MQVILSGFSVALSMNNLFYCFLGALWGTMLILFMMVVNLRGVKESGNAFATPSYFFLGMVLFTIGFGFYQYLAGTLGTVPPGSVEVAHAGDALVPISLFLILRAFAGGCTALTGVEAISNGITAFKEPRSHNAGLTLIWMSVILGINLFGQTFLSNQVGVMPSHFETGFSQIGRWSMGLAACSTWRCWAQLP